VRYVLVNIRSEGSETRTEPRTGGHVLRSHIFPFNALERLHVKKLYSAVEQKQFLIIFQARLPRPPEAPSYRTGSATVFCPLAICICHHPTRMIELLLGDLSYQQSAVSLAES